MKRSITVFGIIAGLILSAIMAVSVPLMCGSGGEPSPWSMVVGYTSMALAFAMIFVAVKTQRDKRNGGAISFGQALGIGLGITLIASAFYTLTWVIIYKNFYPTFLDDMISAQLAGLQRRGASAAEISKQAAEFEDMRRVYSTWPGLIGWTLIEVMPAGLLLSLIAALVMKRKRANAASGSL